MALLWITRARYGDSYVYIMYACMYVCMYVCMHEQIHLCSHTSNLLYIYDEYYSTLFTAFMVGCL